MGDYLRRVDIICADGAGDHCGAIFATSAVNYVGLVTIFAASTSVAPTILESIAATI